MAMITVGRRTLLRAGAAAAALAALPRVVREARAGALPKNLIVVLNAGGWDQTYTLDPKPGVAGIDAPSGEVRRFGNVPILVDPSRPNVTSFFQQYGATCTVINGIMVRSFIHPDCTKRILTGTPSDANPDLGAIAAYELARDLPVPYLVLGASALSGPLASITGRAGDTNQLTTLLSPEKAYPDPATGLPAPGFVPTDAEEALVKKYLAAGGARLRATRGQRGANAKQVDAFLKSLDRAGLLRDFARSQGGWGAQSYTPNLAVQVSVGVAALEKGLSHSVMMQTNSWDTHTNNGMQSSLADKLYGGLLTLAQALEQKGLLSKTVVLVLSEMGRTPKLNAAAGKDHWPVTSALVFGGGLAGGKVLGGTDDQLGALAMNLGTGAVETNGRQLQTDALLAGLLKAVGVDPSPYLPNVESLDAFMA
jgi:Protein of unknown function (DUF1501)